MKLNTSYTLRSVAGEYMLIKEAGSQVNLNGIVSLSESAAWLWEQVGDSEFEEEDLVRLLVSAYDVDEDEAAEDVHELVLFFRENGLVTV